MRTPLLAALCLSCLAAPALADGPITTSNPAQLPAPMQVGVSPPLMRVDGLDSFDASPAPTPRSCAPAASTPGGQLDTAPHGEVDVGVGTDGYRHLSGAACKPLGDTGSLAISIGTTQFGTPPPRR